MLLDSIVVGRGSLVLHYVEAYILGNQFNAVLDIWCLVTTKSIVRALNIFYFIDPLLK
jgi:hypothetical protein